MKITNVEFFHLNPRLCDRYQGHEVRFSGIDTQTVFRVTSTTASLATATSVATPRWEKDRSRA